MTLSSINQTLLDAIIKDEHQAGEFYFKYAQQIDELCSNNHKIYSRIDLPSQEINYKSFTDKIFISSILSDVSRIYPTSGFATYFGNDRFEEKELLELLEFHKVIDDKNKVLTVREGYFVFNDNEAEFLQTNFAPLFETGILTLTPDPNLMVITGTSAKESSIYTIPADIDFKNDTWRVPLYDGKQKDIPIRETSAYPRQSEIIHELMIPFISGLSAHDFSLVMQDENDLISSLRNEIKKITQLKDGDLVYSSEIYQDVIRPRVDKINHKFKSISELHSFKMKGVTVFTSVLSLLSLAAGDYMGAASIIIGLGTGTAGLVKFEADYHSEINNLKNDSMYLLWKLQNTKRI